MSKIIENALIVNIVSFGPRDENGIGLNSRVQYIDLERPLQNENFKGYSINYNIAWSRNNKALYQKLKQEDMLRPCKLVFKDESNLRYNSLEEIIFKK